MIARVWRDERTDRVNIVLGWYDGTYVTDLASGDVKVTQVAEADVPPIALSVGMREWELIVREWLKVRPMDDDARDAIADAREVRDRLLTLIERDW